MKWLIAASLAMVLIGCSTTQPGGVAVSVTPVSGLKLPTPFGPIEVDFTKQAKQAVASADQLPPSEANSKAASVGHRFAQFAFYTGKLPDGCKDFEGAQYGSFALSSMSMSDIEKLIAGWKKGIGVPAEASIAFSIYNADAFRSLCGPVTAATLVPGSKINGWLLNPKAVEAFATRGQSEVDVTPSITIIVLDKNAFQGTDLLPTAANVLMSRYRFEIPPNVDSLAFDPKSGSLTLAFSRDYRDVTVKGATRNFFAGGFERIYVGDKYIYLIDVVTNTAGISESSWNAYQDFVNSFRYVGTVAKSNWRITPH